MKGNLQNFIHLHRVKNLAENGRIITQTELAKAVGCSKQHILRIEKGYADPSLSLAFKMAEYFKTDVNNLFKLKD